VADSFAAVRSITERYWRLVMESSEPRAALREFCQTLESSGALSLSVAGDLSSVRHPAIFVSNHVTVLDPLKILAGGRYSVPYHSILMDYVIERETGRPVSHISANPRAISSELETAAERLGFILTERDISPSAWKALSRRVAATLAGGSHISLAPEGHFHSWNAVGPFKRGFAHWAKAADCDVVPVLLSGFETLGPELKFTFAHSERIQPAADPETAVNDLRTRVFGGHFQLSLLEP
jgi:1-acyl-sn-glycerol-3-phosphate acyltransferase